MKLPTKKKEEVLAKKEEVLVEKEKDIARLKLIVVNLQRMLFGSKKERFETSEGPLMALLFPELASKEEQQDQAPVKEN